MKGINVSMRYILGNGIGLYKHIYIFRSNICKILSGWQSIRRIHESESSHRIIGKSSQVLTDTYKKSAKT